MYAIIETGGKQVKVEKGQEIYIEKVAGEAEDVVTFDKVLFVGGDDVKVGVPFVEGASVTGKVVKQGRAKKITVYQIQEEKELPQKARSSSAIHENRH